MKSDEEYMIMGKAYMIEFISEEINEARCEITQTYALNGVEFSVMIAEGEVSNTDQARYAALMESGDCVECEDETVSELILSAIVAGESDENIFQELYLFIRDRTHDAIRLVQAWIDAEVDRAKILRSLF